MNKSQAIILAAGQGTRMNHPELPKVLVPLGGKPMIGYVLETLKLMNVLDPVIVIKYKADLVRSTLGEHRYVQQSEKNGTGAAALSAKELLGNWEGLVFITNGDNPFFGIETYWALSDALKDARVAVAIATGRVVTMGPTERYGRVIRSANGLVERIVEYKDASKSERQVEECNAGLYLVRSPWLWSALERIQPSSVTGEYYITDLVSIAIEDGHLVAGVPAFDDRETHGVNTPEELVIAEKLLKEQAVSGVMQV